MASVEWDLLLEFINADLNQQQVNVTPAAVNQMPVEVLIKRKAGAQDSTVPYIKKPLNAFMLFMKEQRPVVKTQFLNENSAAVNKIMGQMWKSLSLEQQQKYYEESERLNIIHASTYPGWSCRDNYGKKKKRMWGSAATGFNNRSTPAPELPALVHAPSASSCNWHEAPQVEPTSVPLMTSGASLVAYVPLSSSPWPASSCPTYTQVVGHHRGGRLSYAMESSRNH